LSTPVCVVHAREGYKPFIGFWRPRKAGLNTVTVGRSSVISGEITRQEVVDPCRLERAEGPKLEPEGPRAEV